jgi:peptide/nickel transport system ATP-binding protein
LIPPSEADLTAEQFRAVAAMRFTLATGELPEAVDPDGGTDPAAIRDAFDLPDRVPDDTYARAVEAAVTALADGDLETATERLESTVETVCEREAPEKQSVDGVTVRCHRYDPEIEAEPPIEE